MPSFSGAAQAHTSKVSGGNWGGHDSRMAAIEAFNQAAHDGGVKLIG
jgi:hypothetical protein